ncbi:MAG: UvrD-helicase domain-containing protein, partial [Paraprevotella sp.]|nr:UvrD-helicase domain-containing protein [Paraprevotella sp.]
KTRVLTYKIAYLLEQGYEPWSILALTFTNKAAREMQERIGALVGGRQASRLWMGTFHSIFSRILRTECDRIGFTPRFTIYDSSDSRSLVKSIIREMNLDDKVYKPNVIQNRISAAKNHLVLPEAYVGSAETMNADKVARVPLTGEIYRRYQARLRQSDAMDFDDLLLYTYLLLKHNPEVCARYEEQFKYVLVDEYQDTNFAQHCIVWELTKSRQRVCVVGDDAQSIYSFRGARIDNILNFSKIYTDARLFKLEQNYRSTKTIVGAANSLINRNRERIPKTVFSNKEEGEPITVFSAYSDIEEADIVVNRIEQMRRREDMSLTDFVILYRTNAQSRTFEEAMRKRSIPYRIYGGLSFYQRKEIKDVIAYFRMVVNPRDEEALKRIVNYPARGIGQTTLSKVAIAATEFNVSQWEVLCNPLSYGLSINSGTHGKLQKFVALIESFRADYETTDAHTLALRIVKESGVMNEINQDRTPEGMSRQENVQELMNGLQEFVRAQQEEGEVDGVLLTHYLQNVALLTDQDEQDDSDEPKVTLMTVHAAKGLEFRVVFVVGMEEDLFPNVMAGGSGRELEEERRLFYVALTRAEEYCFLTYAKSRYRYGKTEFCQRSRFLNEIDSVYLRDSSLSSPGPSGSRNGTSTFGQRSSMFGSMNDMEQSGFAQKVSVGTMRSVGQRPVGMRPVGFVSTTGQKAPISAPAGGVLREGQIIEHERFGVGTVVSSEGVGENAKATVRFQHVGEKTLLLRFARFKVLG